MTERKLATIRVIEEVKSIEGADKICAYRVGGWWVVDQVGKYTVGDKVVYVEIDSWIPHKLAPFLSKGKEPREFDGIKGERLRTIKLKGQVSQGLLLPVSCAFDGDVGYKELTEDMDVTDWLGIIKWEKPVPAQLAGLIRGNFPSKIPKTDQERIQNLTKEYEELQQSYWAVTEKLDGTSCTFYLDAVGEFHVCSRNLDLKRDENNTYWKMAIDLDIERKLTEGDLFGLALQGEIIGENIQGNQYKCKQNFNLFSVYSEINKSYLSLAGIEDVAKLLGIRTVPIISRQFPIEAMTMQFLLAFAEGKSQLNDSQREGLVFQSLDNPNKSFKVISNAWLLKNE
jgi:RNA ligase (TIGR02306 family)